MTADLIRPILFTSLAAIVSSSTSYGAALSLFNAEGTMITEDWRVVNDDVMGGISRSSIQSKDDGSFTFKGTLSLENNGGFASIRSPSIDADIGSFDGIELIVTGDGKSYKCTLRTDKKFDGISHQASFDTVAGKEQQIRIPFEDFDPTWRGRRLSESKRMKPAEISSIGFMISDKQEGPFELEIKSIRAYRNDDPGNSADGTDIKTSNGVIHLIDSVRIPPGKEPLERPPAEKLISSAITRGVPLFNNGNHQACADMYELAAEALLMLPEDRLNDRQREILTDALGRSQQQHSATERAWTMRIGLDKTLAYSVE